MMDGTAYSIQQCRLQGLPLLIKYPCNTQKLKTRNVPPFAEGCLTSLIVRYSLKPLLVTVLRGNFMPPPKANEH